MFIKIHTKPLAVLFILLAYATLNAQGWERTFGDMASDVTNDMANTPDGGWLLVGTSQSIVAGDRDIYLLKADVDGSEQWHRYFRTAGSDEFGNAMSVLPDNGILIAGQQVENDLSYGLILKTDSDGNIIWMTKSSEDSISINAMAVSSSGEIVAVGSKIRYVDDGMGGSILANDVFVWKLDSSGDEIWSKTFGGNDIDEGYGVVVMDDGSIFITGYTHSGISSFDGYLIKTNADGDTLFEKNYGDEMAEEQFKSLSRLSDGRLLLTGFKNALSPSEDDIWMVIVDEDGEVSLDKTLEMNGLEEAFSAAEFSDGNIIIAGQQRNDSDSDRNAILVKTDNEGNIIWQRLFGGQQGDNAEKVIAHADETISFCGFTQNFGAGSDGWLVKTDANGLSYASIINGNVFNDFNLDGVRDTGEDGIRDWLIAVTGNRNFFASTDSDGNYSLAVDTGDYSLELILPNDYWLPNQNNINVSLTNRYDSVFVDFAVQKASDCSFLTVDVSTPFLRRCFPNTYSVKYCNKGTEIAPDATLDIEIDEFLIVDSTSIPWSQQSGNVYTFNIGDLEPFECGTFRIYTTVSCDSTVLGQTHCVSGHIRPDSICLAPDPFWDGSSIEVDAFCSGDSVVYRVSNKGTGHMSMTRGFIIIEDDIITRTGTVPLLLVDEIQQYSVMPDGKTVRIEVEQSEGHPGNSKPSVTVEGCGESPFSTGFVTQLPQDDGNAFVEIDCQENIGSYDPNDKRGFPKGYGANHFIEPNTDLEYIIRFQNTGTDTAFTVVIRDTLSHFLNPVSIIPGASSHPYLFSLYDEGVVKFTFNNILLPDSTTNEPASHGFVKFRISQDADLPPGTIIYNSSDIYFDFNPPIKTNYTYHEIESDFIISSTSDPKGEFPARLKVSPNPFSDYTIISLDRMPGGQTHFILYDLLGNVLRKEIMKSNSIKLDGENMARGIYFFKVQAEDGSMLSGTLIMQ